MGRSNRLRIKKLGYRDQAGRPQAEHQEHWRGFRLRAGRTIVAYVGDWGTIQVWAADEAEGRRVIAHACAIAGIPIEGVAGGEWIVTTAKPGRNGQAGVYETAMAGVYPVVSKREGGSGPVYL